jgi:hypothetical protein
MDSLSGSHGAGKTRSFQQLFLAGFRLFKDVEMSLALVRAASEGSTPGTRIEMPSSAHCASVDDIAFATSHFCEIPVTHFVSID